MVELLSQKESPASAFQVEQSVEKKGLGVFDIYENTKWPCFRNRVPCVKAQLFP